MSRQTKFAHDKNIERRTEALRDFVGHWHATSRQAENGHIIAPSIDPEFLGELTAGLRPIVEIGIHRREKVYRVTGQSAHNGCISLGKQCRILFISLNPTWLIMMAKTFCVI